VVDVPARHLDEHGEIKADPVIDGRPETRWDDAWNEGLLRVLHG
jgi:hypothetical protein